MNNVIRNALLGGLLWLAVPLSAQVSQDLIDKAKAAGMTDEQIRQEMNKRMGQSGAEQTTCTASDAVVTDRTVTVSDGKGIPPLDAQREANRPAGDLSGTDRHSNPPNNTFLITIFILLFVLLLFRF